MLEDTARSVGNPMLSQLIPPRPLPKSRTALAVRETFNSDGMAMESPRGASSAVFRTFFGLTVVLAAFVSGAGGQANVTGQWSVASYTMPINPIHSALLKNGKILVIAGSGNCPASQSGCPSGPPFG